MGGLAQARIHRGDRLARHPGRTVEGSLCTVGLQERLKKRLQPSAILTRPGKFLLCMGHFYACRCVACYMYAPPLSCALRRHTLAHALRCQMPVLCMRGRLGVRFGELWLCSRCKEGAQLAGTPPLVAPADTEADVAAEEAWPTVVTSTGKELGKAERRS